MSRVVHFEIHADDPSRAVAFYSSLLGWKFHKWDGPMEYWLVTTGPDGQPGINGGLLKRQGGTRGDAVIAYVCTVNVDALDAKLRLAESLGGQVVVPKRPVPGVGWQAYCKDTEGNVFGVMQPDPAAA